MLFQFNSNNQWKCSLFYITLFSKHTLENPFAWQFPKREIPKQSLYCPGNRRFKKSEEPSRELDWRPLQSARPSAAFSAFIRVKSIQLSVLFAWYLLCSKTQRKSLKKGVISSAAWYLQKVEGEYYSKWHMKRQVNLRFVEYSIEWVA